MKYVKLVLSGLLIVITACEAVIYGFLGYMYLWLFYSLLYLAIGLFQRFRKSSVGLQVLSLSYIALPFAGLTVYGAIVGFTQLTQLFYIIFLIALALALGWEIFSLCLVAKEKSDEKKQK